MRIAAEFVTSAASAAGLPNDRIPEVALVGRSNVGKSSVINALVRQTLARTSAAPGKTRLANIYRVARGSAAPLYLVDLPGYGYARGGDRSAREFEELSRALFGRVGRIGQAGQAGQARLAGLAGDARRERLRPSRAEDMEIRGEGSASVRGGGGPPLPGYGASAVARGQGRRAEAEAPPPVEKKLAALLLIDSRHPGLESDLAAWEWLKSVGADAAIVATKIDKLARGQRIRAMRELESAFEDSVLPVSAVTGEGLDELWKLIDRLANSRLPTRDNSSSPPRATAPPPPTRTRRRRRR